MGTEYTTIWQATGAGIGLVISSMFYALGGRKWKVWRRFIGSFVIAATVCIVSLLRGNFSWWLLAIWPLVSIGYHLGYGGTVDLKVKILKRSVYAGTILCAGALCAYLLHGWLVFMPHVGVAVWSVYLGVRNPVEASFEEWYISMLLNLGLIAYPFVS